MGGGSEILREMLLALQAGGNEKGESSYIMAARSRSSRIAAATFLPMGWRLFGSFQSRRSRVESARRLLLTAGTMFFSS